MINVSNEDVKDITLNELKQWRRNIHRELVQADGESTAKLDGLHHQLEVINRAIADKEAGRKRKRPRGQPRLSQQGQRRLRARRSASSK
jgi:hypothetical protein